MKQYLLRFPNLALLGLFVFSGSAWTARQVIDKSVATVNDEIILESDIEKFQNKIKSKAFKELFGGIDEKAVGSREGILQLLIEEKIINQQVKKLELAASDQEVEGQIRAITTRNGISPAQLTERLKQLGTTMPEYKEGIRRQIERRNLIEREIKPNMEVSEDQLRHFYLRNLRPEDVEVQYHIAHILIENKGKGKAAAERANAVWKDVSANPDNFAALVKETSDDTSSHSTGGDLGQYSKSQLAKEFRDVVPKTPVGKVTQPIKTSSGYHIVKVLQIVRGDFANLSKERKETLRNQMVAEELEKRMAMWLDRKKNDAFIRLSTNQEKPNAAQ